VFGMTQVMTMELEHGTAYAALADLAAEGAPLQPTLAVSATEVDQFIERMRELVAELAAFPEELEPRPVGSVDASARA
jgi:hypothetical protein